MGDIVIQILGQRPNMPSVCPVCGDRATSEGAIPALSAADRIQAQRASLARPMPLTDHYWTAGGARYHGGVRRRPRGAIGQLSIPACERHAVSFEETGRLRGACGICSGVLFIATLFLSASVFGGYALTGSLDTMTLTLLIVCFVGLLVATKTSGASELEKAVRVLDVSSEQDMIVLAIKSRDYANEILRLNPTSSKLLKDDDRQGVF